MLQYGKVSINPEGLEGMTKADFFKVYTGILPVDINGVWKDVLDWRKANKKKKK